MSDSIRLANSKKFQLGTTQQSSIYYNASDLIINPKETGTGKVYVLGQLNAQNYSSSGLIGITKDVQVVTTTYPLGCWMNYTAGILTSSTC